MAQYHRYSYAFPFASTMRHLLMQVLSYARFFNDFSVSSLHTLDQILIEIYLKDE
jgi:hypothetical protein